MKTLLKSLIVWLMFVAIPFQGFAAASMLTCAPQAAVTSSTMTPEHCAMMAAAMQHQQADAAPSDHAAPHQHTGGKCSTCASCLGVVMAPPAPSLPAPGETPALAACQFTDRHVARVDLALPERPPRFALN